MEEKKEKLKALTAALVEDPEKRRAFFFEPNEVARGYGVEFPDTAVQIIKQSGESTLKTLEKGITVITIPVPIPMA